MIRSSTIISVRRPRSRMSKQTLKPRTMVLTMKCRTFYVDKPYSGFLTWAPQTKAYIPVPSGDSPISWESESKEAHDAIKELLLLDTDRFKQRGGAEMLAGITRGRLITALNNVEYG